MKRILFYTLLIIQIIAVLLIVIQYNLIDTYGETKSFKINQSEEYFDSELIRDYDMYTFELDINEIPKEKFEGNPDFDYRDAIYVLLKKNKDGIYEVVKATEEKITTSNKNELVLLGKNFYKDDQGIYHVNYDFETINVKAHKPIIKDLKSSEITKVTYKFASWNQSKLISIE